MKPKVSIITACYNGEYFFERWKKSLLNQDYDNIEVLFVNDGSSDLSYELAMSSIEEFENRGFVLKVYTQENKGIGPATNVGLSNMSGEYFMIFDMDDILESWCVSDRVGFLERNKDCGFVLSDGWFVNEGDLDNRYPVKDMASIWMNIEKNEKKSYVFKKRLLGEQGAGTLFFMFRTSAYKRNNPALTIYPSPYVQDSMIFLFTAYDNLMGYISNKSYRRVVVPKSHSSEHLNDKYKKNKYLSEIKKADVETIKELPISNTERDKYLFALSRRQSFDYENDDYSLKVILWGSGAKGKKVKKCLDYLGVPIVAFLDNNPRKNGMDIDGIKIYPIEKLKEYIKESIIVVTFTNGVSDAETILQEYGGCRNVDYYLAHEFLILCERRIKKQLEYIDDIITSF